MIKKIYFVILTMILLHSANAITHTILVGQSGLTFSPSTLNVIVGDVVRFEWVSGVHTTTSVTIPSGAASWTSPMSANVTSFDYTVTTAGEYDYQCNPHGGSGMVGSFTATAGTPTGVVHSNLFTPENVILSPNPATTQTNLSITLDQNFKGDVKVFSAQGILVSDFTLKLQVGVNLIPINTETFSNGMYFVNISDKKNALYVTKLIVSN